MVSPAVIPVGVTNVSVWFDTVAGAESERVSLKEVTLAASAKRIVGTPIDHKIMARVETAAVAWSKVNEFCVLFILLYVV